MKKFIFSTLLFIIIATSTTFSSSITYQAKNLDQLTDDERLDLLNDNDAGLIELYEKIENELIANKEKLNHPELPRTEKFELIKKNNYLQSIKTNILQRRTNKFIQEVIKEQQLEKDKKNQKKIIQKFYDLIETDPYTFLALDSIALLPKSKFFNQTEYDRAIATIHEAAQKRFDSFLLAFDLEDPNIIETQINKAQLKIIHEISKIYH